jgi:peptidyl-dipeptidase Dcp
MPADQNPLLADWDGPFGLPPFAGIRHEHFMPAFEAAILAQRAEVDAIAENAEEPTFANTVEALERSGRELQQVGAVFFNLGATDSDDELQRIQREVAPILARHRSSISLNAALFARIDALMAQRGERGLDAEQARVLERKHTGFVRAGAKLDEAGRERIRAISERLATLGTSFTQNLLADEKAFELVLEGEEDLAGLPDFVREAALQNGAERGKEGQHVVTLSRSIIEPFLQFSARPDLREAAFAAWAARGEQGGETDNREIIEETLRLRHERAGLLGFSSFAAYKLDDQMAKTPAAVKNLLLEVWAPAREKALAEAAKLEAISRAEGSNTRLAPADWRYYAEKQRKAEHDLDEAEIKPYLQLERMIEAAFDTAGRLFGLAFKPLKDLTLYHPDVRAFEVLGKDGRHLGLFLGDYFARPSKRSGAWKSGFREQQKLIGEIRPIVVNVMNFAKAPKGAPTLLTFDDARTLFHEFGHALHGLMSDVTYPSISGTSVSRDFVELPSQLYEHWLAEPAVLRRFAVHKDTGEPMPEALLERMLAAKNADQGFRTVEYTASALTDLELHDRDPEGDARDAVTIEQDLMAEIGMPGAMIPRHRVPHFAHVFAGEGYSAGYYSYLWSEVMGADAFLAFEEAGDVFDPETAARLAEHVLSAGGRKDPAAAYEAFRGRLPTTEALLGKRGLKAA